MAQLSEKAVAHQELNSIIRNAFFLSRSSNGVKNKDEIADSWTNYKDRINLDKINYQAKTRLAVDMILDNDIDFEASVADQQNFEVMNILHKFKPDMYLSRHPGSTVWAIKNGTPAIYVADEYMIFGYKHTLEFAKTVLDAINNRSFEENLAKRTRLPYTDWWYQQNVDKFLEETK